MLVACISSATVKDTFSFSFLPLFVSGVCMGMVEAVWRCVRVCVCVCEHTYVQAHYAQLLSVQSII